MKNLPGILILTILIALATGCSSAGVSDITQPGGQSRITNESPHQLWGYWQFTADPEAGTLDVIPLREAGMHLNAMRFLEPPVLAYLTIENLQITANVTFNDSDIKKYDDERIFAVEPGSDPRNGCTRIEVPGTGQEVDSCAIDRSDEDLPRLPDSV